MRNVCFGSTRSGCCNSRQARVQARGNKGGKMNLGMKLRLPHAWASGCWRPQRPARRVSARPRRK